MTALYTTHGPFVDEKLADGSANPAFNPALHKPLDAPFATSVDTALLELAGRAAVQTATPWDEPWEPGVLSNFPRRNITNNTGTGFVSGTIYDVGGIVIPRRKTVAGVGFKVGATAAGTPTHWWAAITRLSDRHVIAVTADQLTASLAANTVKELAFAASYTAPDDTDVAVYVSLCFVATTVPTLYCNSAIFGSGSIGAMSTAPVLQGTSNTGQTTPPAVGATLNAVSADGNATPYVWLT